ncbi:MAG: AAA family ATPase [Thermoguttaceae bacterium]
MGHSTAIADPRQTAPAAPSGTAADTAAAIQRSLELLHEPGATFEIRALGVRSGKFENTVSGYYNDFSKAARDIAVLDANRKPRGIYCTLNPCNPALLARANNRLEERPKHTTQDSEILRRRWLYLDIDPARPSGIAATGYEVALAKTLGMEIEFILRGRGWPAPLKVDSGNGVYRLYRIDLPNDEASTELIKRCYGGLNELLGSYDPAKPHATLDTGVYNAARILRVGGTWNRKGDPTSDRPHRICVYHEPDQPAEIVPPELIADLAALAPSAKAANGSANGRNGSAHGGGIRSRLLVADYLRDHGIEFRIKEQADRTMYLVACPFDASHGQRGETAIIQRSDGLTCFECKHTSCLGKYQWRDYRDRIGKPDPQRHYDPPLPSTNGKPKQSFPPIAEGTTVKAGDRGNYGTVLADNGDTCTVHFRSPEGQEATKEIPKSQLRDQNGAPIDPAAEIDIGKPVPLAEIIQAHPDLRPAVIDGLLRRGETMNIIAAPKQGKSWLAVGLALAVADGIPWLETFQCEQGRVLLIDAELHPETISHRLPMAATAAGVSAGYSDQIDVWAVRGVGANLLTLASALNQIEAGQYALVILDAWYRFLPPGISENDNAAVMSLYNTIDGYAARLNTAWVNIHHASKGDQSGKGTTDVGSGAGAQSRAADTHLVIRPHEEDGVAVVDTVVRSWPPVDSFAIRWDFPAWFLDRLADPTKLRKPRERSSREDKERHLDADRQAIVNAMHATGSAETKSFFRDLARIGNPRFGYAWASLVADGTITQAEGVIRKGNGKGYEAFILNTAGGVQT